MRAHAVDIVVVLAAPFPCRSFALEGHEIVARKAHLLARDASVRAGSLMLVAADDAVVIRTTADGTVVV